MKRIFKKELNKRKPGTSKITSPRKESDKIELLSGVFNGKTDGTPICGVGLQ
ncbi:MAG: chorismate synthase [Methanobrevibacter boviskoreani]|uniref:chorismate synthase n=1 Tax=Methanobrevibacter boviskoreani TaxID=1348249 RepID=UPI003D8A4294